MNSRELASVLWIVVAITVCLSTRSMRVALIGLARAALPVIPPVALLGLYVVVVVVGAKRLGVWNVDLISQTVTWFVLVALALLFGVVRTWTEQHYWRTSAVRLLGAATFLSVFMNLITLHLALELALQPLVALCFLVMAVDRADTASVQVRRMAEWVLALVGLLFAGLTIRDVTSRWNVLDKHSLTLEFALPIWLTLTVFPFIFCFSLYICYEGAFKQIDVVVGDRRRRFRVKIATVAVMRLDLRSLSSLRFGWATDAGESNTLAEARTTIRELRHSATERHK